MEDLSAIQGLGMRPGGSKCQTFLPSRVWGWGREAENGIFFCHPEPGVGLGFEDLGPESSELGRGSRIWALRA